MKRIETFSRVDSGSCRPHLAIRGEIRAWRIQALYNIEQFEISVASAGSNAEITSGLSVQAHRVFAH
jgi:hypothetical protein